MKNFSLPKSLIIGSRDFQEIFEKGKSIHGNCFSLFYLEGEFRGVGFTVKKEVKNKPDRNRLKRRTRELWRLNFRNYQLPARIVILTQARALNMSYRNLEEEFIQLLCKLERILSDHAPKPH